MTALLQSPPATPDIQLQRQQMSSLEEESSKDSSGGSSSSSSSKFDKLLLDSPEIEQQQQQPPTIRISPIRPPEKRQRVPSAYNRFIKEEIQRIKTSNPDMSHREAFSTAAKNWAHFPHIQFGLKR